MNTITRFPQSNVTAFLASSFCRDDATAVLAQSPEMNRLLTAAVVNRRFCRLLLANPLAALSVGYRGEAFRLNPNEVNRLSKIRATSLRDFAFHLLLYCGCDEKRSLPIAMAGATNSAFHTEQPIEVKPSEEHEWGHAYTTLALPSPVL